MAKNLTNIQKKELALILYTKEEQLKSLYRQLAELNDTINEREKGARFPSSTEADTISKLASAIKKMETEVGLSDIIATFSDFLKWVRSYDLDKAKELAPLLDAFVQHKAQ